MRKLLYPFVLFAIILSGCSKEIIVERKEFHPSDDELITVLTENNTNWHIYRSDLLAEEMKAVIVSSDDESEYIAVEYPTDVDKTIGVLITHKSEPGQRTAFQYMRKHINSAHISNITDKAVNVCCDLFAINAADEILKDISKIKAGENKPYNAWYKEYGGVYVWFTYGVENGEIIPLIFSINDEGIHNELLADME